MPNISLRYLYRDYANYKNHGEEVFSNTHQLSLEEIEQTLRAHLLDDTCAYQLSLEEIEQTLRAHLLDDTCASTTLSMTLLGAYQMLRLRSA